MGTATRTVVFTDLANYTASVSRSDREALRDLLRAHEALVLPTIERHGGRTVKNLGDSFMALFDAATDAIRAALDLVEQTAEGGLSLRVSAATGDVEEIDGDAFGEAVNLASRINSKTPADEVWFSESTQQCMNQAEIPWDRVGLFSLKGIAGEAPVYRAVPRHRAWLPDRVVEAARKKALVLIRRGEHIPPLPPDPTILLLDFAPGSEALTELVNSLPVLDPANIWLVAYNVAPGDRHAWQDEGGHGLVIGTSAAVESVAGEQRRTITQDPSSDTIILDTGFNAVMELTVVGLALPEVPMSDVVAGYSYDLLSDGRWVIRSDHAELRLDVSPSGVFVVATSPRVMVDGRALRTQDRHALEDGTKLVVGTREHRYHAMKNGVYVGLLLSDTPIRMLVAENQRAELGREPNHPGLGLPDRRGQQNIRWCAGPRAARARESGFTLDRALAGRRQAAVKPVRGVSEVEALHSRCPTYIWKDRQGVMDRVHGTSTAEIGDHIIAGTSVIALRHPLL